jgi:hypothetical protein
MSLSTSSFPESIQRPAPLGGLIRKRSLPRFPPTMDRIRYFENRTRLEFSTFTELDRAETRKWLSERLLKAGCSNEKIRLRMIKAWIKQYPTELEEFETIHEKLISLRG